MHVRRLLAVGLLTLTLPLVTTLAAQAPVPPATPTPPPDPNVPLYFEVASIKLNTSGAQGASVRRQPGGRVTVTNMPLRQLIAFAYQTTPTTLIGGPGWLATERYDIVAKLEGDPQPIPPGAGPDHAQLAFRTLFAERFKLQVHREKRELDVYALVVSRSDGTLGRALKKSTQDCSPEAIRALMGRGGPPPAPPAGSEVLCGVRITGGRMLVGGMPITAITGALGNMSGRNVVDRTGLTGVWDFELTFAPEAGRGLPPPGTPNAPPPPDPDAPSIFTALQEQLGLKLDSTKAPLDVVVIDSVAELVPE